MVLLKNLLIKETHWVLNIDLKAVLQGQIEIQAYLQYPQSITNTFRQKKMMHYNAALK